MKSKVVFDLSGTLISQHQSLYSGIEALLIQLQVAGFEMNIWTALERSSTLQVLKKVNLGSYFDDLSCRGDKEIPKPHPAGLKRLIEGQKAKNCFMIGDSAHDMAGAKACGITGIGALWNGHAEAAYLEAAGASFCAARPEQVLEFIQKEQNHV